MKVKKKQKKSEFCAFVTFSAILGSFYRLLPHKVSERCGVATVAFNGFSEADCSFFLLLLAFLKDRCATRQVFDLISVSPEALWLCTGALTVPYQREAELSRCWSCCFAVCVLCEGVACFGANRIRKRSPPNRVMMTPKDWRCDDGDAPQQTQNP